jgi:ubiquinone/menaquinone biosynthesis C-methylase UbiE
MESVERLDRKKGLALYKYYSEMKNVLTETFRVLKPGGTAVFVVGDSTIPEHLCAIGKSIGFSSPLIGTRRLDRNRRMMPASTKIRRMHEEYVLVFSKPSSVSPGSADAPQSSG